MNFINITDNKSLIFIIISSIIIFAFATLSIFLKFYKFKNSTYKKIFNNKNLIYLSCLVSTIISLTFLSFNNFRKINNVIWVWECISFLYSVGIYMVAIAFIFAWLVIPIVSWKAATNYFEKNTNFKIEIKKLAMILFLMLITMLISNIEWFLPLNDRDTPLTIFEVKNTIFKKDMWFLGAKFLFNNAFLTIWYPWTFLCYSVVCLTVSLIIAKVRKTKNKINNPNIFILKIISYPYIFIDCFGSVWAYCFVTTYYLFNVESMFIHIGILVMIFLLIYLVVDLSLMTIIAIIYKDFKNKRLFIWDILKSNFIKQNTFINLKNNDLIWWYQKIDNSISKNWNLCDASIVGLAFTVFLGFANNFDFETTEGIHYNNNMYSINFWILLCLSGLVYNYFSENQPQNFNFAKHFMGASTYSVTPGLQTGIFGWLNPLLKKSSNFTNQLISWII